MKNSIIILMGLLFSQLSVAQTLKTYEGLYSGGQARYTYYEDENENRIKQGYFQYTHPSGSSLKGNYKNNLRNGEWTYTDHTPNSPAYEMITVNYVNGVMSGLYTYRTSTEVFQFTIMNNRIVGDVSHHFRSPAGRVNNDRGTISGHFNENGYPDGVWTCKYHDDNNYTVTETYINGCLISRKQKNESTGEVKINEIKYANVGAETLSAAYDPAKGEAVVDGKNYRLEPMERDRNTWSLSNYTYLPIAFSNLIHSSSSFDKDLILAIEYAGVPFAEFKYAGNNVLPNEDDGDDQTIYEVVGQMPEFPDGGTSGMTKYLNDNIKYPPTAYKQHIQGRVAVQFVVNKDGSIENVKVLRGVDPDLDKEAIRVISSMPKWKPGMQRGKPVRVKYTTYVMFKLP